MDTYLECRRMRVYPNGLSILEQTAFTMELLDFLDTLFPTRERTQPAAPPTKPKPQKR